MYYQSGIGVPRDYLQARKLYRRAAEQGDSFAEHNLGLMYASGHGGMQDYRRARRWIQRSLTHGNKLAARGLASLRSLESGRRASR
jgi:TPR repeat protein